MKKIIYYLLLTTLSLSCKPNNEIVNLDEIITSKNLKINIDKFIEFTKKNNPKDCILIQGNEMENGLSTYFLQNYRPYFLEGDTSFQKYHNEQQYNQKYSVFTYKGIDIFVTNTIKHKFNIKSQETKEILDYFDYKKDLPSKEEADRNKTNTMMLKINTEDKIVFEKMVYN